MTYQNFFDSIKTGLSNLKEGTTTQTQQKISTIISLTELCEKAVNEKVHAILQENIEMKENGKKHKND